MSKARMDSGVAQKPYEHVTRAVPCPRCGTELDREDLDAVVGKGGVSPVARCRDCTLLWSPKMGWFARD